MSEAALVIGGRGGIGYALAERWRHSGRFSRVLTTTRQAPRNPDELHLDLREPDAFDSFAGHLGEALQHDPLDAIVFCSGVLHDSDMQPERRLEDLNADTLSNAMQVNALGPLLLTQSLWPLLPKARPSQLVALSARVGSISDNRLGGWYAYRMSKAALNQGFRTLSIELRRRRPQCRVTLFHPGTVATRLSQPFRSNVPAERLFSAERAARQLDQVVFEGVRPRDHMFLDWRGQPIAF